MADVKVIVKQMKEAGMTEQDIISNLKDLGIQNPEEEMSSVLKELEKTSEKEDENGEDSLKITKITKEGEDEVDVKNILEEGIEKHPELMKKVASSDFSNADDLEDKLDQIIALLKALQDLNKKILEVNRDLLVRINKKTSEGEKPTLGKLF